MNLKLLKHRKIDGKLTLKTGMRIGGSKEEIEIGGMDNPIIREPINDLPYIPGSSLKGKLRSSLEYKYGKVTDTGRPCGCAQPDCLVCRVFGPHIQGARAEHGLGPSRIIVRDASLTEESKRELAKLQEKGLLYAEVKTENIIDRRTGSLPEVALEHRSGFPQALLLNFISLCESSMGTTKRRFSLLLKRGSSCWERSIWVVPVPGDTAGSRLTTR